MLKKDMEDKIDIMDNRITELHASIRSMNISDELIRRKISVLLDCGTDAMSWEETFFRLGELYADANYSCVLHTRDRLQNELDNVKEV